MIRVGLDAAARAVRQRGARNARVSALRFYERRGIAVDSDEFVPADTGVPHRTMCRELDRVVTSSFPSGRTKGPTGG